MTGVPGGDVTLHAAITAELALHQLGFMPDDRPAQVRGICECGWTSDLNGWPLREAHFAHVAEWVLAVLADRLPHTPPDQLADLIGGTVLPDVTDDGKPALYVESQTWPLPDSPPAAPEPQCTCYFTPRVLAPPCPRHPAAPEPRQDT